ncbi:XRE family transcriptional regulator [Actinomadura darangshiensis]|uniref:XRE family transcriptional regulator n=1 Tax=Actinomadura darangshiensis TaxID=705336 RepID=A0A4R5AH17_9ACTN|nr:helix-turn-helix transcriptional regulator [Actinomadura darangshiensis]TDD70569.1 XRE family transcriptional regulator [Actinomadura darangshiensis]
MPIVRDPLDPKISMWHFLAFCLRFWREKLGLSLTQCGEIIGVARSTVSNMEAGRRRPQDDQMRLLDKAYGTGVLFQVLLWFARMAHDPDWGRQIDKYEEEAVSIKSYHGQVIPLVLQTDDYTWAYVKTSHFKDLDATMARRVAKKKAYWDKGDALLTWTLIDEAVLMRPAGGKEVMREQLEHLLVMADLPHVSLRVIPFSSGEHMGVGGSVQIIGLEDRDVAYSGALNGGRLIESPGEVRELSITFDRIGVKAASEEASREIIKRYLEMYR